MTIQYIGRLHRPHHPIKWGVSIAVCLAFGLGSILAALLLEEALLYLGVAVALVALGITSFILLRGMEWVEVYDTCLIVRSPFGEVTRLEYANLEAVSRRKQKAREWLILWDGRPLSRGVRGKGFLNGEHIAVRIPCEGVWDAILAHIPVAEGKAEDRRLLTEAVAGGEATFLWRDTVYELTRSEDGHLILWAEQEEESVLVARFVDTEDFIRRGHLHATPASALVAPVPVAVGTTTKMRAEVVKETVNQEVSTFLASERYTSLATFAKENGYQVKGKSYLLRPSPTIAYEGGVSLAILDGEGKTLTTGEEPLAWQIPAVVADEVGHIDLYPLVENKEMMVAIAVAKEIIRLRAKG